MRALIVPRGLSDDYYFFLKVSADANDAELIVDRRTLAEVRRQARPIDVERRVGERRRPLPETWETSGFITVERPDPPRQG